MARCPGLRVFPGNVLIMNKAFMLGPALLSKSCGEDGRDGRIRTADPMHPKHVRYQAAPRPDARNINYSRTSEKMNKNIQDWLFLREAAISWSASRTSARTFLNFSGWTAWGVRSPNSSSIRRRPPAKVNPRV